MPSSAPDYYKILGISKDASESEIKKAFRKLAQKHHPDAGGDEEKFKEINEAYEVLSDPEKKKVYDTYGTTNPGFSGGSTSSYGAGAATGGYSASYDWDEILEAMRGGGFSSSRSTSSGGFGFDDMFGSVFGGFDFGGDGVGRHAQPERLDIEATLKVDLKDIINGATKRVTLSVDGENRTIDVKIPKQRGTKPVIRLRGQGRKGASGNQGDILIHIETNIPSGWEVSDVDVIGELRIPFPIAITGGKVTAVLPSGKKVKVNVPKSTQAGKSFAFKGEGVKADGKTTLRSVITIPDNLTTDELKQIEAMSERIGG